MPAVVPMAETPHSRLPRMLAPDILLRARVLLKGSTVTMSPAVTLPCDQQGGDEEKGISSRRSGGRATVLLVGAAIEGGHCCDDVTKIDAALLPTKGTRRRGGGEQPFSRGSLKTCLLTRKSC